MFGEVLRARSDPTSTPAIGAARTRQRHPRVGRADDRHRRGRAIRRRRRTCRSTRTTRARVSGSFDSTRRTRPSPRGGLGTNQIDSLRAHAPGCAASQIIPMAPGGVSRAAAARRGRTSCRRELAPIASASGRGWRASRRISSARRSRASPAGSSCSGIARATNSSQRALAAHGRRPRTTRTRRASLRAHWPAAAAGRRWMSAEIARAGDELFPRARADARACRHAAS